MPDQNNDPGAPPRKRGRPPKSPEQRRQDQERRVPPSYKGRMRFRPGDPHALDVQFKEARNFRQLIIERIDQLQRALAELEGQEDPSVQISQEELALKSFLWETYKDHKHRDHILATFLAIRRQRLLARLEAACNALELASELLASDDKILRDLRHAVSQAKAHTREESQAEIPQQQTILPEEPDHQASGDISDDQADEPEEEEENPRKVDHRHIYGDAEALRAQLAAFDERVKQMRGAITMGIGWFDEYYIYKERLTYEARRYIMRGEKLPDNVQMTEIVAYGPYLKWRRREAGVKGSPIITVQMGRIPGEELAAERSIDEADQEGEPWPNL